MLALRKIDSVYTRLSLSPYFETVILSLICLN